MPRQIKDEYEILEEIGSGGMATVHKAMQKSLKRPVAIKELKKSFHSDAQIVQRFERESMVAASLQHENIVHIYDYWKKPNYCIVMEHVDGINLAEVIAKAGALPVDVAIMIAIQVCGALDYAHMRGLIHRDIKPSNIMIKRNGEVKLMDFGIAHTRSLESLTMPGMMVGTPAYMSPEQILGQNLDIRSDIFSFGIVLYELFTGVKPFTDDDTRAVSAKIVKDKPLAPRRINRAVPRGIQRVIRKCMNKKPQKRFESMLDVERRLGKRLAGKTTKPASLFRISEYLVSLNIIEPATEQETIVITAHPSRRRRFGPVLAAVLLLALSGAFFYRPWTASVLSRLFPAMSPDSVPSVSDQNRLTSSATGTKRTAAKPNHQTAPKDAPSSASLDPKKEQTSAPKKSTAVRTTAKKKKRTTATH